MTAPAPPAGFLDYDKSLACIHCGLCLASCPTYLETGNENDSPRGRIYLMRAIQDGRLPLAETPVRHIDLCLGCRACEAACPSGVQYGELLEQTRDHIEKHHRRSTFQNLLRRVAIERIIPFPRRLRLALVPARLIRAVGGQKLLPVFARDALSLLPDRLGAARLAELSPASTEPGRGRVGFVSGCVMSILFGETNANSVRLLNRAGYDVVTPPSQGCCGALYAHGGNLESARASARCNIEVFARQKLDAIIINAAGCGSALKEYGQLLRGDPLWAERAKEFSAKIKDLSEFLILADLFGRQGSPSPQPTHPRPLPGGKQRFDPATVPHPGGVGPGFTGTRRDSVSEANRVTYHDACHLAHPQQITKQPRDLVKLVAGENFVELPESDVCCGSAGSYNLTEPEMAGRLQRRKVENILKTGAQTVVTTNPGCILQIRAGLKKAHADIEVLHIADFLMLPISPPDGPATT